MKTSSQRAKYRNPACAVASWYVVSRSQTLTRQQLCERLRNECGKLYKLTSLRPARKKHYQQPQVAQSTGSGEVRLHSGPQLACQTSACLDGQIRRRVQFECCKQNHRQQNQLSQCACVYQITHVVNRTTPFAQVCDIDGCSLGGVIVFSEPHHSS